MCVREGRPVSSETIAGQWPGLPLRQHLRRQTPVLRLLPSLQNNQNKTWADTKKQPPAIIQSFGPKLSHAE